MTSSRVVAVEWAWWCSPFNNKHLVHGLWHGWHGLVFMFDHVSAFGRNSTHHLAWYFRERVCSSKQAFAGFCLLHRYLLSFTLGFLYYAYEEALHGGFPRIISRPPLEGRSMSKKTFYEKHSTHQNYSEGEGRPPLFASCKLTMATTDLKTKIRCPSPGKKRHFQRDMVKCSNKIQGLSRPISRKTEQSFWKASDGAAVRKAFAPFLRHAVRVPAELLSFDFAAHVLNASTIRFAFFSHPNINIVNVVNRFLSSKNPNAAEVLRCSASALQWVENWKFPSSHESALACYSEEWP